MYSKSTNISVPSMCDMYNILYNCLGLFIWKVNKSTDINYTVTLSMPNLQQIITTSLLIMILNISQNGKTVPPKHSPKLKVTI